MLRRIGLGVLVVVVACGSGWYALCRHGARQVRLPVKVEGKWGYIDGTGRMVISPRFERAEAFREGLAPVCETISTDGRADLNWGYIDCRGRYVIAPQYQNALGFTEGIGAVYVSGGRGRYWQYIDRSGRRIGGTWPDWLSEYSEGLAAVQFPAKKVKGKSAEGLWGYVDRSGKCVIGPKYPIAGDFHDGLAAVGDEKSKKWGYIDHMGRMVIPPRYTFAGGFSDGRALVQIGEKCGFIDTAGREVIRCRYFDATYFQDGMAAVCDGPTRAFINRSGKVVIRIGDDVGSGEHTFSGLCPFSEGLAGVQKGGLLGFMDKRGRMVIQPRFAAVDEFQHGYVRVTVDGERWGYIDRKGKWIWKPTK